MLQFTKDHRGEFDEVWLKNADVHVERMGARSFWIGINSPGGDIMINTGIHDGEWYFNVSEDAVDGRFFAVRRPAHYTNKQKPKIPTVGKGKPRP